MVLTAMLIGLLATAGSVIAARETFRRLGLDVDELLVFFGLAELPTPQTARRRRLR